jgi:hypothetical protein
MSCSSLNISLSEGSIRVPVINNQDGGPRYITASTPTAQPVVTINGALNAQTAQVGQLASNTVSSGLGSFGNAAIDSGLKGGGASVSINSNTVTFTGFSGIAQSIYSVYAYAGVERRLFTEYVADWTGFYYMRSGEYKTDTHYIVESRWQRMLRTAGTGKSWEHKTVTAFKTGDTACYPGEESWTYGSYVRTVSSNGLVAEKVGPLTGYKTSI